MAGARRGLLSKRRASAARLPPFPMAPHRRWTAAAAGEEGDSIPPLCCCCFRVLCGLFEDRERQSVGGSQRRCRAGPGSVFEASLKKKKIKTTSVSCCSPATGTSSRWTAAVHLSFRHRFFTMETVGDFAR